MIVCYRFSFLLFALIDKCNRMSSDAHTFAKETQTCRGSSFYRDLFFISAQGFANVAAHFVNVFCQSRLLANYGSINIFDM